VPVDSLHDPVEVLVELPREPRLPDARDAGHGDELRALFVGADVEDVLDLPQLAVAAHERRLETLGLQRPAPARDDAQRAPESRLALRALQLVAPGRLVDDRPFGRPPRRLAHEDRAGLGHRLHARSGVHHVPRDHALADGGDVDRSLAGHHTRPGSQSLDARLLPQRLDGRDEIERGPNGSLRVVLRGHRRPPRGHDRIADELLHHTPVELDQPSARVEVARQQLAHLLRVTRLRQGREPDEVGEQHRNEPALGNGLGRCRSGRDRRRRRRRGEWSAALAAEALVRFVGSPAGGAFDLGREGAAAARAELPALAILASAGGANHRQSLDQRCIDLQSRNQRRATPTRSSRAAST
jgi:hypothetical protein